MTARSDGRLAHRRRTGPRLAESALAAEGVVTGPRDLADWLAEVTERMPLRVRQIPLDRMTGWERHPETGNYHHRTGRFFSIEGLDVRIPDGPVRHWNQPIIHQPEIGILGILAREFDGVLHFLMQAKVEPGNGNGVQLSPTVQATHSNYSRVHGGKPVPYLHFFRDGGSSANRALADVRQSEQGARFFQKRNRNIIVETTDEVEVLEGFRWLTLGQIHRLLEIDDLVNMDARTVLSCLPFAGAGLADALAAPGDPFRSALARSCEPDSPARHELGEVLSWITQCRVETAVTARRIPLAQVEDWGLVDGRISHRTGRFFDVVGVDVTAGSREVSRWCQPMIAPGEVGVIAFLVREFHGVLHVLVRARTEAGYVDVVELGPTVQCTPANYRHLPRSEHPPLLREVLSAPPERIRYDTVLSEEGGRFYRARNRYLVVEAGDGDDPRERHDFRWLTLYQLVDLLRHSHYLNVEARSLVACLHSLATPAR